MIPKNFCAVALVGLAWIGSAFADDLTPSPKATFTIGSRSRDDEEGGKSWSTYVLFPEGGAPETALNSEDEASPWRPEVQVSPDDQWILRIQKIGSDLNTAHLFHVEGNQRVTRLAQPLEDFAWQAVADEMQIPSSVLNALSVEFVAWDLANGVLKFKIHGVPTGDGVEDINRAVSYDLEKNKYTLGK